MAVELVVTSALSAVSLKVAFATLQWLIQVLAPESVRLALLAWLPEPSKIYEDLLLRLPEHGTDALSLLTSFKGMSLRLEGRSWWIARDWSRITYNYWAVALISVAIYLISIPTLKALVKKYGKWDVRNVAFYWNAGLSLFSFCGVAACVPTLLSNLMDNGLYFTCCAPPQWYGNGLCGLFVVLFIYSKVAELIDTVLLLLAGKPVIALQWWHHATVLLYCWHSISVGIATGLWFAAMNYSVHSVMYGYFAITSTKYRKLVTPFAIFITLAQLLQMMVGMYVTMKAVLYQANGEECYVNKTNSILGLTMYFSYFVLFLKLFINNYVMKSNDGKSSKVE